jgi:hypothetical protein
MGGTAREQSEAAPNRAVRKVGTMAFLRDLRPTLGPFRLVAMILVR